MRKPFPVKQQGRKRGGTTWRRHDRWRRILAYELGISLEQLEEQGHADEALRAMSKKVAA